MAQENNNNELGICLNGGLGNQLFMLFAGVSKAMDENRDFKIYYIKNNDKNSLFPRTDYFDNILTKVESKSINYNVNLVTPVISDYNNNGGGYKELPQNCPNIYGYFQHFLYSFHNRDKIIKCLGFDDYLNSHKFPFKTIGLHFRFEDNQLPGKFHLAAKSSYFIIAITKLQELLKQKGDETNYKYVIFSTQADNELVDRYINEINENLSTKIDFIKSYDYLKEYNNNDYDDFFYISNCDHFILPHYSTFSLFANYLTYEKGNKNKIVMYPDLWEGYGNAPTTRMFFDEWIRIYE